MSELRGQLARSEENCHRSAQTVQELTEALDASRQMCDSLQSDLDEAKKVCCSIIYRFSRLTISHGKTAAARKATHDALVKDHNATLAALESKTKAVSLALVEFLKSPIFKADAKLDEMTASKDSLATRFSAFTEACHGFQVLPWPFLLSLSSVLFINFPSRNAVLVPSHVQAKLVSEREAFNGMKGAVVDALVCCCRFTLMSGGMADGAWELRDHQGTGNRFDMLMGRPQSILRMRAS